MEEKKIRFKDDWLDMMLTLSIGEYDSYYEGEEAEFYIGIFDDDDLCYQYDALSADVVLEVFDVLKKQVNDADFYSKVFPETCELYGMVRNNK